MNLFCNIEDFKEALRNCTKLLQEDELKKRGLEGITQGIEKTRNFLHYIIQNTQKDVNSYEELIKTLYSSRIPPQYSQLCGLTGKFLDAIQILKPSTVRNCKVRKSIIDALKRTGHLLSWEELKERQKYEEELVKATATYELLEVAFLIEPDQSRNPINTLRISMGARLPDEYFAELMAGWIIEDVLKENLESKKFDCSLEGPDKERKIQVVRPLGMGIYDFKASKADDTFYLELQRVGKISKERGIEKVSTYLKRHKYEGGNVGSKILILWIGEPSQQAYKKWSQKVVFIANVVSKKDVDFKNDCIYLPEKMLDNAPTWEDFRQKSISEILGLFKDA